MFQLLSSWNVSQWASGLYCPEHVEGMLTNYLKLNHYCYDDDGQVRLSHGQCDGAYSWGVISHKDMTVYGVPTYIIS